MENPKTNAEVRRWYLERISRVSELNERWLGRGVAARERAEKVWRMRRGARLHARSMMADSAEVELLRRRDSAVYGDPDGPTFEFLVEKLRRAGLEGDSIFEAIIEGAYRTDVGIDESLGL